MSKSFRRDSSPRRRSPSGSSRRRSPSPSRSPTPRRDDELPTSFGRAFDEKRVEDDMSVLTKMKKGFKASPLNCLTKCLDNNKKIKVWTRNFKEVRGICTGYVGAFDKHWNLIMTDVDEVYLRPVKGKTPYMDDVDRNTNLPDLPPRVPKQKKTPAAPPAEEGAASPEVSVIEPEVKIKQEKTDEGKKKEGGEKEKKKRKKKKKSRSDKRHLNKLFIRGDQIVMVSVLESDEES